MAVTTTLHTQAYIDFDSKLNHIKTFAPVYHPQVEVQLGPLYEQALDATENGQMREEEFQQLRSKLRAYGMRDMQY